MKQNIMILMLVVAIAAQGFANTKAVIDTTDEYQWDKIEKILFGVHIATSSIDLMQAYTGFKHDNIHMAETNVIINNLGPEWLPAHFVLVRIGLTYWALNQFPSGKWRKAALTVLNAFDVFVVVHNHNVFKQVGIRY
ncbi:hypothetical protein MYX06_01695 [Patescibacteria group bacterium AH-259-L05]|nr:hypothetical protein [Patescibacteria group bacterium AH-259-L05]